MWQSFVSRTRSSSRRPRNTRARRTNLERLEERQLLSYTDFELSSLLPVNGGDGSKGFFTTGIVDRGMIGSPATGYQPVGDVNGDGIDDLLLAAPGQSSSGVAPPTEGYAYLIFGRSGRLPSDLDLHSLDGTMGYVLHDPVAGDSFGIAGGGAGDINHDGAPDLAIGAFWASPAGRRNAGETFVLYGGASHLGALDLADGTQDGRIELASLDGWHGFEIDGVTGDFSGRVSGAGDVNGDYVDDLVIGAHGGSPGRAYVVFGRDSTAGNTFPATLDLASLNGSDGFVIPGLGDSGGLFGRGTGAGDVNGDGIGDLIVAAPLASPSSGRASAGKAYVIFGRTSFPVSFNLATLNGSNGFTVNGAAANDMLGFSVDGAGDFNGDGFADVLIGARGVDGPAGGNSGAAYVIFGKTGSFPTTIEVSTLNGSNGFALRGAAALDDAGGNVSIAGDLNGDGYDDMILGANYADPNGVADAGQSYIVYGKPHFAATFDLSALLAANGGDGSAGYALNGFIDSGNAGYVAGIGDVNGDGLSDVRIGALNADSNGLTDNGQVYIVYGKASPPATKFYVVNDGSPDRTYEYTSAGTSKEDYALGSGNTAPRGAASTVAGDKIWVVDNNKKVYVYNPGGTLLGSWTAGSLHANATVEGITTNGTDVWIVDSYQDKVFRYNGTASRLSGSQNAAGSFNLNSSNSSPKDIVTDGTNLWVVNDTTSTDKVFKYNLSGSLLGSWTITGAGSSPTGITLDPSNVSNLWMVDSGTRRVYQFDNAAGRTSGSQSPSTSFTLAAGNANPQGIADPPVLASGKSPAATLNRTSHPSGRLAAHLGRTIPGLPASKSTGSILSQIPGLPSVAGRQEAPILLPLVPSTDQDQDITLLAADVLRTGAKRSRSMLARTKV